MKNIKVYIQYPWKFPDSSYYNYLIDSPPKGIEYLSTKKQGQVITNKKFFWFSNRLKKIIRRSLKSFNLAFPNAHLTKIKEKYDLIHCAHCLSKNKNKPWITDIEMIGSFAISGWNTKRGKKKIKDILMRKNCKKILPWTESIKRDILKDYPEIENKLEVVYPAIPKIKNLKKIKNKKLKIIFVARYFDIKGGVIALEVLEKLRKKHKVEGIVVSNVPHKLKKEYSRLKIYNLIPQEKLFELMVSSDIFLYPGSVDTFGFSLLEAMAFGLPTITINTPNTKSRKEIIENNKTGLIFDVEKELSFNEIRINEKIVIDKLVENCSKLIQNRKLREEMSKNCLKEIKWGRFSIRERNKKLKKIYIEALK